MNRLPDLEAWAIFAKVAEHGSFSGAAKELGLSKATVSKAVARLESRLGTQLFHRTSRQQSLTDTGRELSLRAARILAEAEAVEADGTAEATAPRGHIRMAAPMSFGLEHVAPALPEFLRTYPAISVDLHLSDERVDLIAQGFDLALRIAALPDSSMVARRLCQVRRILVGSPDYLARKGRPRHPSELPGHHCLGYAYLSTPETWRFTGPKGEELSVPISGPLRANNADALMPALRSGVGLAIQPDFVVWRDLKDGRLEALMPEWSLPAIALHMITPPGAHRPAKVVALVDFLVRRFKDQAAPWRSGSDVTAPSRAGVSPT